MRTEHCVLVLLATQLAACASELGEARASIVEGAPGGADAIVAVIHTREDGTRQLCTGTLVAPRVVLTAKHCTFEDLGGASWSPIPVERLSITLGADIVDAPGETFAVARVDTTDGPYRDGDGAVGGDVALLTLDGSPALTPIAIDARAPSVGTSIGIVGFGFTEAGGTGSLGARHEGVASIVSVASGTFTSEGAQWTCTGDSGGPALDAASGAVIGVTSIGPRGCRTSSSIYTRLDVSTDLLVRAGVLTTPTPEDAAVAIGEDAAALASDAGTSTTTPSDGCACRAGRARPPRIALVWLALALAISARGSGSRTRPRR